MEELDEVMKHYGVLGMKWGVRRSEAQLSKARAKREERKAKKDAKYKPSDVRRDNKEIQKRVKKKEISRREGARQKQDNIHKFRNESNKAYNKAYNKSKNKGRSEYRSRVRGSEAMQIDAKIKTKIAGYALAGGTAAAKVAYSAATSPENIRRGKNFVQAVKRSPIRYVDGDAMKNVVN